ncbi:HNH endonuclease [Curtobacterium flaccumfaciens]|nr:HNH endonuclease [Curtobacterium flaccumfaciens]
MHPELSASGIVPPSTAGPSTSSTVTTTPAAEALRELRALPVSDAYLPADYDRDAFGPAWADTDRNGCDTRNDVLRRDLTAVVTKPGTNGCVVLAGTLHDPYTARTIVFERGNTSSLAVQIDHRVPLSYAWRHGAATWTPKQRELFANDQATNLVAVDGPANEEKSNSGPAEWMPANTADACSYSASFVTVATKWHLSIATDDKHALDRTLTGCASKGSNR